MCGKHYLPLWVLCRIEQHTLWQRAACMSSQSGRTLPANTVTVVLSRSRQLAQVSCLICITLA